VCRVGGVDSGVAVAPGAGSAGVTGIVCATPIWRAGAVSAGTLSPGDQTGIARSVGGSADQASGSDAAPCVSPTGVAVDDSGHIGTGSVGGSAGQKSPPAGVGLSRTGVAGSAVGGVGGSVTGVGSTAPGRP